MNGPLAGVRIVEISATGPVALFGTIMTDLGATVLRIDRPKHFEGRKEGAHVDNRPVIELDLKRPESTRQVLDLVRKADVLVEGYRPGVIERLGLGPDQCLGVNPALVYARCTGWGQNGPLAQEPGHDINYLALTGALAAIGTADQPILPLNLVADYGGGSMFLCLGVLAALLDARRSGRGQVIDMAMIDGVGTLFSLIYELRNRGEWQNQRWSNRLDGAAPFYRCYRCKDGKWVAVGALEMKFRRSLATILEVPELGEAASEDPANWPALTKQVEQVFLTAERDEWMRRMEGRETCCSPVLDLEEAPLHPHNQARNAFLKTPKGWLPAPAPNMSATPARRNPPRAFAEVLAEFGVDAAGFAGAD